MDSRQDTDDPVWQWVSVCRERRGSRVSSSVSRKADARQSRSRGRLRWEPPTGTPRRVPRQAARRLRPAETETASPARPQRRDVHPGGARSAAQSALRARRMGVSRRHGRPFAVQLGAPRGAYPPKRGAGAPRTNPSATTVRPDVATTLREPPSPSVPKRSRYATGYALGTRARESCHCMSTSRASRSAHPVPVLRRRLPSPHVVRDPVVYRLPWSC